MSDSDKTTSAEARTATPRTSVIHEGLPTQLPDIDPDETQDWLSHSTRWSPTADATAPAT